ncbi:MAG TPA: CheR family methyltransferase, partial [Polyangiaceae bacterium]|nr:CheR family methyltransferase [Polyangiaceae bacterium]
ERRLLSLGDASSVYLSKLEAPASVPGELRELAQELTVGETYFFRHTDQFRAFSEVALTTRIEARAASKQLRLLSAGCSSGEEAYTLSILTRDRVDARWEVAINAVDMNPKALERAREARYSSWALRETPEQIQKQYFTADGREYVLAKAIRDSVKFEEGNLVADDSWAAESCDVIFCRNVLMYFTPDNAQRVVERFARALAPGGFLFLGHAENLRGLSQAFELLHTHGTFYYRRRDASRPTALERRIPELPMQTPRSALALDWTSTWLETVQRSSDRIRALTEKQTPEQPPTPGAPGRPALARLDLSLALELLSHERFAEALDVLTRMPASSANDADAVLLRAALLTHCGRFDAAELACSELLVLDALSAGAHYLRSLCRERQSDTRAAIEYAQIACYLEPSFAMPHLHLGLIARRTGDRNTAQRELTQAALLLQREEASRLLLFGGGFSREGLAALCQSELERLKGAT